MDMVVRNEAEYATLCKHCRLVVERTVAEVKHETRGYAIAVNDLGHVSNGYECAFKSFERNKAMRRALKMADRNRVGLQVRTHQESCKQRQLKGARRETEHRRHLLD